MDSAALSPGTLGLSLGTSLAARVRALQSRGAANILSQPSILTADNLGAMIDPSETFYCCAASGRDGHAGDVGNRARDAALSPPRAGRLS